MTTAPNECSFEHDIRKLATVYACGFTVSDRGMLQMTGEELQERHETWHNDPPEDPGERDC